MISFFIVKTIGFTGALCDACLPNRFGPFCRKCADCGLDGTCVDGRNVPDFVRFDSLQYDSFCWVKGIGSLCLQEFDALWHRLCNQVSKLD